MGKIGASRTRAKVYSLRHDSSCVWGAQQQQRACRQVDLHERSDILCNAVRGELRHNVVTDELAVALDARLRDAHQDRPRTLREAHRAWLSARQGYSQCWLEMNQSLRRNRVALLPMCCPPLLLNTPS